MKYLSIDPGTRKIGIAVWQLRDGELTCVHSDPFTFHKKNLGDRYNDLYDVVVNAIETYKVSHVVCEAGFVGPNRNTSMILAGSRAIVHMASTRHGMTYEELTPSVVKKLTTGRGNASKKEVKSAVHALIPGWWIRSEDEADAIAIGYAYGVIQGGKLCN